MKCQGFESRLHGNVRAQRAGRAGCGSAAARGWEEKEKGPFIYGGRTQGARLLPAGARPSSGGCGGQHLPAQPLVPWPVPEGRAISHGGKSVRGRAAASIRRTPSLKSGPEARGGGSPAVPCTPVCRSCSLERAQGVRQCGRTQVPPKGLSEEERRPRGRAELGESRVGGTPGLPCRPPPPTPPPATGARPLRRQAGAAGSPACFRCTHRQSPASSCPPYPTRAPLSAHTRP